MEKISHYLKSHIIVGDGAFGTYYGSLFDTRKLPEEANITHPERVEAIHRQYIEAGAGFIRTNTYASNTISLKTDIESVRRNIRAACRLAAGAAADAQNAQANQDSLMHPVFIAGDIGPIPYSQASEQKQAEKEYIEICKIFMDSGADAIIFETFSQLEDILPALRYIKGCSDIFVAVQFAVNQYGYSSAGLSARRLLADAAALGVSAAGLNCGIGPGHMAKIFSGLTLPSGVFITAMPNSGYPQAVSNRMVFAKNNEDYFARTAAGIAAYGARIIGGCCGTTPACISRLAGNLKQAAAAQPRQAGEPEGSDRPVQVNAFYAGRPSGSKLVAVELAPPFDSDDSRIMEAAHFLQQSGVDVLTFPDSPSGRTRADAILTAEKVFKETGICVMPHLCCRDKNAIAMRSQLLGAHINGIRNFLVITGDPVPSMMRQTVKSVFNFDSVGLMNIIRDMNEEQFAHSPVCYGGAINQNRLNPDAEAERIRKKIKAGAEFFLTQPVFDEQGAQRLRHIKEQTQAKILCGIMPLVSMRNALFMKNEMTGIEISDDVLGRYRNCETKEDGEAAGIALARDVIAITQDFADGYYFTFPFNRVHMLPHIMEDMEIFQEKFKKAGN